MAFVWTALPALAASFCFWSRCFALGDLSPIDASITAKGGERLTPLTGGLITSGGQNLAALLAFITDVHALGLRTAQGLIMTEAWYWDMNDANRAFTKRFAPQYKGIYPSMVHAGVYSAVLHYLKAVEALKSDADGKAIVAKMKEMPTDDPLFGKGTVRADGRKIHPMYLFEVKKPAESKGPWDYYKLRATIPANEAFRPLAEGGCPLVRS